MEPLKESPAWQQPVIFKISLVLVIIGLPYFAFMGFTFPEARGQALIGFCCAGLVGAGLLFRVNWRKQSFLSLLALITIFAVGMANNGPRFGGLMCGAIAAGLTGAFYGWKPGAIATCGLTALMIVEGVAASYGILAPTSVAFPGESFALSWTRYTVSFAIIAGILTTVLSAIVGSLGDKQAHIERLNRELEERLASLKETQERYALAVHGTSDGLWDWDIRANTIFYASRFAELLGYEPGSALEDFLAIVHPEDRSYVRKAVELHFGDQRPYDIQMRLRVSDGSYRWFRSRGEAIRDQEGTAVRMAGAISDITESRLMSAERERLIEDLEQKNAELERFTYTVSHDLKSPLVTIKSFLGFLQDDIRDGIPESINDHLHRIGRAANKMVQLLDDLLELSRIGRIVNPPERRDMGEIVAEAVELLDGQIRARAVELQVDPLPAVTVDARRIGEVWQNLLENAIKYFGDQKHPRIHIGHRQEDAADVFFAADNGMGIDARFRDKVFGHFEKLDPATEGSGIGLAIARRIVEIHGGRIWVEEGPSGIGSTFLFSLPRGNVQAD